MPLLLELLQFNYFSVFLLILAVIILFYKNIDSNINAKEPPFIASTLPFFGQMFNFGRDPVTFLNNAYKKYGPVFTFTMLGKKFTYLCDVEAISCFFNSKNDDLNAEEVYSSLVTPVFGSGVIYDVPHNIFMEQKKMIKNGLIQSRYKVHVPIIEKETLEFISRSILSHSLNHAHWEVNVLEKMAELIIFTSSACLMGKEAREALTEEVAQWYTDLDGGFCIEAWLFPEWIPFPNFKKRDAAHLKIKNLFLGIIAKRRRELCEAGKTVEDIDEDDVEGDMIGTFMRSRYKSGRYTTDEEVAKLMISLLMAGQHTSSTTTSFLLLFLAKHQDIQERVYQEILENCDITETAKDQHNSVTLRKADLELETLKKFEILDRCLKETLRLRPPLITLMRLCKKDIQINVTTGKNGNKRNYIIPSGYQVCVSPTFTHRLEAYWHTDTTNFDPDRYINDKLPQMNNQDVIDDDAGENDQNALLTKELTDLNNNMLSNGGEATFTGERAKSLQVDAFPPSVCPFGNHLRKRWSTSLFGSSSPKPNGITPSSALQDFDSIPKNVNSPIAEYSEAPPYSSGNANSLTKYSYIPFGGGRHRCVGEAFAYVQIKTLVATLLLNFRVFLVRTPEEAVLEAKAKDNCDFINECQPSVQPKDDGDDPALAINYRTLISTPLRPYIRLERRKF